jgi:hypothetical protein
MEEPMRKLLLVAAALTALAGPALAQGYYAEGYGPDARDRLAYNDAYYHRDSPLAYHDYDRDERDNGYYRDKQYARFLRDNSLVDDSGDDGY